MLINDVRPEWLVSFLAIVDSGSFSAAAATTHRSQPRVSTHVAALERAVGLQLLDRRRRPVALTDAGRAFAAHAREVVAAIQRCEGEMDKFREASRGLVTLGCYPSASALFLPKLLIEFQRRHPGVQVVLVEESTLELGADLLSGSVDIAVRPVMPVLPEGSTERVLLWEEPLVAVIPERHPLANHPGDLSLEILTREPLITIGRSDLPESGNLETYAAFSQVGHDIEPVLMTNQPQTLIAMVRTGLGIGVTNLLAGHCSDTNGVRLRRLAGAAPRQVAVHWPADRPLSTASRLMLDALSREPLPDGTHPPRT
ncbi:LysR family transcriptional regulator [Nonomuraea roseola]|uniref:LysR family transcriptional regulator n=1 Tax=Nonomuraea roseola TaxID=46179 RepID=A0ABV5QG66_9ACTN